MFQQARRRSSVQGSSVSFTARRSETLPHELKIRSRVPRKPHSQIKEMLVDLEPIIPHEYSSEEGLSVHLCTTHNKGFQSHFQPLTTHSLNPPFPRQRQLANNHSSGLALPAHAGVNVLEIIHIFENSVNTGLLQAFVRFCW